MISKPAQLPVAPPEQCAACASYWEPRVRHRWCRQAWMKIRFDTG
ncbi:MAG: hypothetical protein ABSE86_00010 [Bryobacteraceae bacterium]